MPEMQKEINIHPSGVYSIPGKIPLKPCLTLTAQLHLYTTSFSEMSVGLSVEMTAALTSAVWLSDSQPFLLPPAMPLQSQEAQGMQLVL